MYLTPYSMNAELFIALRDVDYHYILSGNNYGQIPQKRSLKSLARMVTIYEKPMGTSQWVEKCVTETIYKHKSPIFVTKLYFQFDGKNAQAILLRFDVHDIERHERDSDFLGSAETNLETLLSRGSKGIELAIEPQIKNNPFSKDFLEIKVEPGRVFARLEILKPTENALLLQLGLRRKPGSCFTVISREKAKPFYFELHKLNQQNLFGVCQPYTLIYRSELISHQDDADEQWNSVVLPLSHLCNADYERVLKIEIFEPSCSEESKWFALTTLGKMINDNELEFPVSRHDGKISEKVHLYAAICQLVGYHLPNYYLEQGLKIKRVYAVDFSISNWNFHLHKGILHDTLNPSRSNSKSPYEEALELSIEAFLKFPDHESESLLYHFGNRKLELEPFSFGGRINEDEDLNNVDMALQHYQTILHRAKEVLDEHFSEIDPTCLSMMKNSTPPCSTLLSPFLNDIFELLSIQNQSNQNDYFTVFIFTDGQIKDVQESMQMFVKLSRYPVSFIFIGIGFGDLKPLLALDRDALHSESNARQNMSILHFRSLSCWESHLRSSGYHTEPKDLFKSEILNRIGEEMGQYARLFWQK